MIGFDLALDRGRDRRYFGGDPAIADGLAAGVLKLDTPPPKWKDAVRRANSRPSLASNSPSHLKKNT
jgi:hypothetical protein